MTLDDVDLQVLMLDRYAAARADRRGPREDTIEAAVAGAMGGG